ncbi:DUF416 family protein [Microcoleus sp. herbarium2]|uniref:DUF416 family protein n=1 Tax=Microcoleus sp. herbarium2 TaxID=3055433 RepID=UPI002FD18C8F
MNLDFFQLDTLQEILETLPPFHRVAFAASICERMLPINELFSQEESWGDSTVLRNALDEIWQILLKKQADAEKIEELTKACEQQTLHADDVRQSRLDYEAQQTISAVCFTLESCLEPTSIKVLDVAQCVEETIYAFVTSRKFDDDESWNDKSSEELDNYVASHPLAIQEMAKQREDLQWLKQVETLDRDFLERLRTSSHNNGKSLIDLS